MAESVFDNIRIRGTLATVGVLTAATFVATTITATTGNYTTVNTQTLSGATLRTTAGDTVINASGVTSIDRLSGSKLVVNATSAGTGQLVVSGSLGGAFCIQDVDNAGWTLCDALNGTLTCGVADAARCP